MLAARTAHYLRPAGATTIPRTHTILDVEALTDLVNGGQRQHWRLACAEHLDGDSRRGWKAPEPRTYRTPIDLWADISWRATPERRLVVWCHNLAYDLRVSGALRFMPALGFTLEGIALDHAAGWVRFSRDEASVLMVDLCSWLPAPLAKIAGDLGLVQVTKPALDADDEQWEARCKQDVRIATTAVRTLLDTVTGFDLGPWRPTGAGQSHSAWRKRWLTHRPLVHDRLDVLQAEREACWTGRCEAWRHGEMDRGPYSEYDLDLAYCEIAARCDLPSVLVGETPHRELGELLALRDRHAILARVTVTTDQPVAPAMSDEHIYWPVGTFDTVLWDPELALCFTYAKHVQIHQAWVYRRAPLLKDAAEWIIGQLDGAGAHASPVARRMLKHWARAMIGRCALRYRTWERWGDAEDDDVNLGLYHDWQTGNVSEMMQCGRQLRLLTEQQESPDSLPQIPGWVMSECRRRLWELMAAVGEDHLIYVDTDCLIVDRVGAAIVERLRRDGLCAPIHVKGVYGHLLIHGPRMLALDQQRRMSGIPLQAHTDVDGRLSGEVFLSLKESLVRRQIDEVEILTRSYDPAGLDRRRIHLEAGRTIPHTHPSTT